MLAVLGNFAMAVTPGANAGAEANPDATATSAVMNEGETNDEAISDHPPRSASYRVPLTVTATNERRRDSAVESRCHLGGTDRLQVC